MNQDQKAAFAARMKAARAAKSASAVPKMAAKPPQSSMQAGLGKCPNCGKNILAMSHSC